MEKQKDNMAKKQLENRLASNKPELEKVIADRARKIENPDQQDKVRPCKCTYVPLILTCLLILAERR